VIDIVQAAGRALRRHPGKEHGYILLPLVVPSGVDLDAFAETTAFRQVARTIAALSTQDERIAEEFRIIEHGRRPSGRIVEIEGNVPAGLRLEIGEFVEEIRAQIWERVGRANWRPFEDARSFARSLGLRSAKDWRQFVKSGRLPDDIPANPNQTYKDAGWTGLGDWLGTGTIAPYLRQYRPFEEARSFARAQVLRSRKEWQEFVQSGRLPVDIPAKPNQTYKDAGWAGMGDWLGTGTIASHLRQYRLFEEARAFARSLGLRSVKDWNAFTQSGRLPADIPAAPWHIYKAAGWAGMGDWLGTGTVAPRLRQYRPFEEARAFARNVGLKSYKEWAGFAKSGRLPSDIPVAANQAYKDAGWVGWGDWLGTEMVASYLRQYRPFEDASAFARSLGLGSVKEWTALTQSGRLPADVPAAPSQTYKDVGWTSWGDWLGTGAVATRQRQYRPFQEARSFVRSQGLRSGKEWWEFVQSGQLPTDIPAGPARTYKGAGWVGMGDWLGSKIEQEQKRSELPG
jgi:hypothetical protein